MPVPIKQSPTNETCTNCKFSVAKNNRLECHYNPPTVTTPYEIPSVWPTVLEDDWCGEWITV